MACLICSGHLIEVLDLGRQPRANGFNKEHPSPRTYDLKLCRCDSCGMVQTMDRPPPEIMFNDRYAYFTGVNSPMVRHFGETAEMLRKRFFDGGSTDRFIVEIGSNDGTFLSNFIEFEHLGIEPSLNVLDRAQQQGIECWGTFFNQKTATDIVKLKGEADLVYAANVIGHVEDLNGLLAGVATLLKPWSTFVFEIYYLPSIVKHCQFDLIYDEHIFYHTINGLSRLLDNHGMRLYDVERIDVHGGSIRGYARLSGSGEQHPHDNERTRANVRLMINAEFIDGFDTIEPLKKFANEVEHKKEKLLDLLDEINMSGKTVVGYGATAKSTTIMNYCNVDMYLKYVVDSTPVKQGTFAPGTHNLRIFDESYFRKNPPDYAILFAWNYAKQIMDKNRWFSDRGGKWILLHPEPVIV